MSYQARESEQTSLLEEGRMNASSKAQQLDRGRSHFFAPAELTDLYSADASGRNSFILQVYGILSLQLSTTVIICCLCMYTQTLREFLVYHAMGASLGCGLAALVVLLVLLLVPSIKNTYPTNAFFFSAFTLLESFTVGVICAMYQEAGIGQYVLVAFAMTCCLFWALTLFAFQSKVNFSFLGGFLFAGIWLLLLWGLLNAILGWQLPLLYSLIGALLFCGFILYDTSRIINTYGYDQPFVAAIELYLDFINLFLYILQIITRLSRSD